MSKTTSFSKLRKSVPQKRVPPPKDTDQYIHVTHLGNKLKIPVEGILYMKAEYKYVSLITILKEEYLTEISLNVLQDQFGDEFIRIHRNCLVRVTELDQVSRGGSGILSLKSFPGERFKISRRNISVVRGLIKNAT